MALTKTIVRVGVISALAAVAGLAIVGPVRARLLVDKVGNNINSAVDSCIDDPAALRAQIRELESQYAPRIAAVRTDLAQLRQQSAELRREQQVAQRVVDLAQADLGKLTGMLAQAQDLTESHGALASAASYREDTNSIGEGSPEIRLNFNNESLTIDQAVTKATRVEQVVATYTSRQAEIDRDLGYMSEQEKRLADLADKLEAERAEFQTQLAALDHQIDAIARNDRLITIMEKRQDTIDRNSRYEAGSLENLKGRLAEMRTKQEAQLESLGKGGVTDNYEAKAKIDLDARNRTKKQAGFTPIQRKQVIEIGPGDVKQAPQGNTPTVEQTGQPTVKASTVASR
jgi:predicted RNase H-like nuclease (RuvC/YqgF family)